MARNDRSGEEPQVATGEWREIQLALQLASKMAKTTADVLGSVRQDQIKMHVVSEHDPRIPGRLSPYQLRVLSLLSIHFRLNLPAPQQVNELHEAYQRIHKRLTSLKRGSFRLATYEVVKREAGSAGGDTFGYVLPEKPNTIFLNETYFSLPRQPAYRTTPKPNPFIQPRTGAVRGHVEVEQAGVRVQHPRIERASVILHEAIHLCYGAAGAIHRALRRGENVGTSSQDCNVGYPQISNYNVAIGDAYVFERFAHCVCRARGSYTPDGAANR